jgi:hypothetical protein
MSATTAVQANDKRARDLTRSGRNYSAIKYGIIPSNLLALGLPPVKNGIGMQFLLTEALEPGKTKHLIGAKTG